MGLSERQKLFLKYTLIWTICCIIIFLPFIPGRKSLVLMGDGFNQNYPALFYLKNWLKELCHGNFQMFDLTIGFGDDVIGTLNNYGFGDILLLPFALVPEGLYDLSYTASVLFRIYLGGLIFTRSMEDNPSHMARIAGGIIYSFSAYTFYYAFMFLSFASPIVWIPLIAWGVRDTLYGKRVFSKKLFIGTLCLSMCGFYYLYMAIIAFGIYLLIFAVVNRSNAVNALRVLKNTVSAIGAAAAILVPAVLHFFQSPRSSSINFSVKSFLSFGNQLTDLDLGIFTAHFARQSIGGQSYDYLLLPAIQFVTALCLFFCIHHIKEIKRPVMMIGTIFAVVTMLSRLVALIFNCFSIVYSRHIVYVFFVLAYMTAETIPYLKKRWNRVDSAFSIAFLAATMILLLITKGAQNAIVVTGIYFLIMIVAAIAIICGWQRMICLCVVSTAVLSGYLYNAPFEKGGRGFCGATFWFRSGALETIKESYLYDYCQNDKNAEFARYDLRGASIDASLMLDIPTTYSYYSICNGNILDMLAEYGISPAIQGSFIYQGLDERQVMESLFSVCAYNNGTQEDEPTTNRYMLPLGIGFDNVITESEAKDLTALEKQGASLYGVIVEDNETDSFPSMTDADRDYLSMFAIEEKDSDTTSETVTIDSGILTANSGSVLSFEFQDDTVNQTDDGGRLIETYLVLPDFYSEGYHDIQLDGKVLRLLPDETFLPGFDRYVNITDLVSEGRADLTFTGDGQYNYNGGRVVEFTVPHYDEIIKSLYNESMYDTVIEANTITGRVSQDNGKAVFYSIPYSRGWRAYVDGKETRIVRADYGFMAIYVPEGEHYITLRYCTPGIKLGALISIISILAMIIIVYRSGKVKG